MKRPLLATALTAAMLLGCPGGEGGVAGVLVVASVDVSPNIVDVILGKTQQLTAAPKTSSGIAVSGRAITWSTTDGAIATVSNSGLVMAQGIGGPVRIRATVDGITGDAVITVRPVPVDHVTVEPPTANVLVQGQTLLTAKAFDANNVLLPGRSFLWQSTDHSIATVTTTGLALGVKEGGPVTISATSEGKTGTASVSVSTRPATRLAFSQQPGLSIAGQVMTPPVRVALQDDLLTTVIGAPNPVTIALAGNPGGATLGGQLTVTPLNGIATFSDLVLNRVGIAYTFQVTSPGLASATSSPFDVIAGSANQLAFTILPSSAAQSGIAFGQQPVLQLKDAVGNNVAQPNVSITASIASGPSGATLGGTVAVTTNTFGVASFTNLVLSGPVGSYTLSFGASGVATLTSGPITLGAGGATQLFIATQPSSAAANGVPFAQQPALQLRDAAGNNVAQAGVVVAASIESGGGAVSGTTTATTNAAGLAAFASLAISGPSGSYTLRFSATGLAGATSGSIVLGAGAQAKLAITTQPSQAAASGAVLAQQPVVQLLDANDNPVQTAGVAVTATVSVGGTLAGAVTRNTVADGSVAFTDLAISAPVGSYTLTFTSPGLLSSPPSVSILIGAGTASQLGISTQPSPAGASGVPLSVQPVIQIRDAVGNPVAQAGTSITATITTGPAGATLGGTKTIPSSGTGTATFTNLAITGPSGTYTIRFAATGLSSVVSNGITLGAGAATKLSITIQPSSAAQSGVAFGQQPVIQLRDAANNPAAQSGVVVTAAIATGGGSLGGTVTATTDGSGVAAFTDLSLSGSVGPRTLSFSAPGLTSVNSGTIALTAGPASQLSITTQPSSAAQSGVPLAQQPVIQVRDAAGNAVNQAGLNVTAAIASGGGTLGGTVTVATNTSGVTTFTNLSITGTAGDRTLSFTSGGLAAATSSVITVTAGAASQLAITTQPSSSAASGTAFAQQPVIQLRDASNNPVAQAGVIVTAAISSGGGTLGGVTTATTNAAGTATFGNLSITGTVGPRTLIFSAVGFTSVTSGTITITAGAATQLTITTQPSASAQSGVAFAQQPAIQLRDASNNAVSQSGIVVTAAIATGGGVLGGTTTATTNAAGLASFTDLKISGSVGDRTLTFTSGALTAVTSNTISVTAGPATQLSITTQPSSTPQSGVAFTQQPVIQLLDASNNPVSQIGVAVTAVITSGGTGTLSGTTTATTAAGGAATFSNLAISGTAGAPSRTLTFSSGALTPIVSAAITLTAGPASKLTITTQPSSSAQSGVAFAQQPVIQLRDASDNPVSQAGVNVTVALASGPPALGGTLTVATNGSGAAPFTDLVITGAAGDRTLSFTSGALTGVTSGTITVTAGAASNLSITTAPSGSAQNDVAFAQQPAIQLRDASNNPVAQAGVVVTAAISSGNPALGGTLTATTDATGLATFANLKITGTIGNRTLIFTATGFTSVTSGTINVTAGTTTQLGITIQPSSSVQSGIAFSQQPVIQLRDVSGNVVSQTGVAVTAAIASGGGVLGGTMIATTNGSGAASFTDLKITGTIGDRTLSFSSGGLTPATSTTVTVTPGVADHLSITTQPSSAAQSGVAFPQQPVIQLRDASNNAVSQGGVAITASIASGPGGSSLGGATVVTTNGSGEASYANLSLNGSSGTYTIGFGASGLTSAISGNVTLGAGSATNLGITTQPSATVQNDVVFPQQPVIQLRDGSNNPVAQSGVVVTASLNSGNPMLGGTLTATTNGSGVATFTNLELTGATGDRTLLFAAAGLISVASNTVTVTAGTATQLSITTQPSSSAQSGIAFAQQPAIQLRDVSGNPVSQAGVNVTAAIASGGGTLGGTATVATNGSGVAAFANLAITGTIGDRILSFSSGVLSGATSNTITLSAGNASQLTITTQPSSSAANGAVFAQQPVIQLRDGGGNTVAQAGVVVNAAIASGGGSLGGTTSATTDGSGVASFTNLSITGTTGARTLTFTSGGLTAATSGSVTITAGSATNLTVTTQPSSSAESGVPFPQQPVLQLRDQSGNPVSTSGVTVVASIASGSGATLGGTTTVSTDGSGVASFTNLVLTGTPGSFTLDFASTGLTSATSGTITLGAGSATKLTITTQPSSSAPSGAAFAQQPAIQLRDASDNPVSQSGVVVTAAIASGGGTLGGNTTALTNGSGVATFTDLSITGTVGDRTLTFTSGALTAATSNTISITTGAAAKLTITTQPSSSAQSGVAFAQQPVTQLRDGGDNPVSQTGVVVTAAIASGGGTLGGSLTATTDGSGVASFTDLKITGTIGDRTLSFSSGALTAATSATIAITAGAASQLTITTQPSSSAQSGVAFAQQPVIQLRDASGNAVSQALVNVVGTIASGSGATLGGTTTVATNGSGVASFTDLALTGTSGSFTLSFDSGGLTGVVSGTITLGAGGATKLTITTQPSSSAPSGAAFAQQPAIQLRDASDNPVSQSGVVVTAAIASGGGILGGTTTALTNGSGVATFTDLSITGAVGDRTLTFTSGALTAATSNTISITTGAAAKLTITTQPSSSASSGTTFPQQPVIQLRDGGDNPVSQSGVVVTAAIASGGGTLGGTLTATTDGSGVATFTDLMITGTIGDRTLSFTSGSLTAATSATITITAGAAAQLAIITQPSASAQSSVVFAQQPVIQLQDASGNAVSQAGIDVTAAIETGSGTLGTTLTVATDGTGEVTFTDLAITGTAGSFTLKFTATGLTQIISNAITLSAGPATKLSITTQPPASATSGATLVPNPVIQLLDSADNPVPSSGVSVTATLNVLSGAGTLGSTTSSSTDGSGTVTFTDLQITGSGTFTITFSSTGLTSVTSITITI